MADLAGVHAVVTRPAHQAQALCELIESEGGEAIRFAVLDIEPKIDAQVLQKIQQLGEYHVALFISPNAVNCALPAIKQHGGLPPALRIGAVGKATAAALREWGYEVSIYPKERFDSEALLALPELQAVRDKHIIIFRGVGGRELLADSLRQRGAHVDYAECYIRRKPDSDPSLLWDHWARHALDIIIITSVEGLMNLIEMVGEYARERLFSTPLLVVSDRMAQEARRLGFGADIVCAAKAGDQQLMEALRTWARHRGTRH